MKYSRRHIDILLNGYFRAGPRPKPFGMIAADMGLAGHVAGLDDLLWKVITGYTGRDADGPRRVYRQTKARVRRNGWAWTRRDDMALVLALEGDGQRRDPPCDTAYVAAVLGRSVEEVEDRWATIRPGPYGGGFGLVS